MPGEVVVKEEPDGHAVCPWAPPQASLGSLGQGIGAALLHPCSQYGLSEVWGGCVGDFQLGFQACPGATPWRHQRE